MIFEDKQQSRVFGEVAETYHRYRPEYPSGLFEWILATCQTLTTQLIIDVGCGTGKASAPLVGRGYEILGLEPEERVVAFVFERIDEPSSCWVKRRD